MIWLWARTSNDRGERIRQKGHGVITYKKEKKGQRERVTARGERQRSYGGNKEQDGGRKHGLSSS